VVPNEPDSGADGSEHYACTWNFGAHFDNGNRSHEKLLLNANAKLGSLASPDLVAFKKRNSVLREGGVAKS